ncbi:hypothetical protein ACFVZH_36545 [Streptomyces sp. NPDC059534]|uniref:hypothetical protein n=1 Tax=Streptomyces sp. NPDC059534 TaxID=3346859 RepID=UPI0036BADED3
MPEPEAGAEVIVVGSFKGGAGKSRLAVMAALYLAVVHKKKVHVVDGDSVSQTAWKWQRHVRRTPQLDWPIEVSSHPVDSIDEHIEDLEADNDVIIADIGGGNPAVFHASLRRAKHLLVPVGADPSETETLLPTWEAAKTAASQSVVGGFEAYVILSRTDHQTSLPREARAEIEKKYPLCDTELVKRVAYQRAYKTLPSDFLDIPALLAEIGIAPLPRKK